MVQEVELEGREPGSGGVKRKTRFRVPQFGVNDDGIMSVDLPWSSQLADRFAAITADPKREVPVDLWRLNLCEEDQVDLKLPPGLALSQLVAAFSGSVPSFKMAPMISFSIFRVNLRFEISLPAFGQSAT